MKVIATKTGYYGDRRLDKGDKFVIESGKENVSFSNLWMKLDDPKDVSKLSPKIQKELGVKEVKAVPKEVVKKK